MDASKRIFAARHGFRAYTAKLYGLNQNNVSKYVTDIQRSKTRNITPRYNIVFDDKLLANRVFGSIIKTPDIIAIINDSRIFDGDGCSLAASTLIRQIHERKDVILKTLEGAGGSGVKLLSSRGGIIFADWERLERPESYIRRCDKSFISSYVEQHDYARALFPSSVNTIRLVTIRDPDTRKVVISNAIQRIGNSESAPVDNFSRGGISVLVDVETGRLLRAAQCDKKRGTISVLEKHPDSGTQIIGQQIPNWDAVVASVTKAHSSFPQAELIAWDIALDASATPILIEANASTDVDVIQIHQPMLDDNRVARFFEYHGLKQQRAGPISR